MQCRYSFIYSHVQSQNMEETSGIAEAKPYYEVEVYEMSSKAEHGHGEEQDTGKKDRLNDGG